MKTIKLLPSLILLLLTTTHTNALSSVNKVAAKDVASIANLNEQEKQNVAIYQQCSPSVAYVTSIMRRSRGRRQRQPRRNRRQPNDNNDNNENNENPLRNGMTLGSGSGFVVREDGYIVTNYHVIQSAWNMLQMQKNVESTLFPSWLYGNNTTQTEDSSSESSATTTTRNAAILPKPLREYLNENVRKRLFDEDYQKQLSENPAAQVYVRVNSNTQYREAQIVDVVPELDVAVLKIIDDAPKKSKKDTTKLNFEALEFGSSDDLLVGQSVVAIGNPFGLDRTVTTGVVSALNRDIKGVAGNDIKNCIQTDASINPGNSGGPLLNNRGQVIGVNTMIITTSGSSAGIGFAIPGAAVQSAADRIIRDHRVAMRQRPAAGWLGIQVASDAAKEAILLQYSNSTNQQQAGVLVMNVVQGSPAAEAGIEGIHINNNNNNNNTVTIGDLIVAIGGNLVEQEQDVVDDFRSRVVGEVVNLTLEDADGKRRIVELRLAGKR